MDIAQLRDIALVVLSLLGIVQVLVLLVLSIALYRKAAPLLESARRSLNHIQGTSVFISDTLVRPLIRTIGFASGMGRGASTILRHTRRQGGQRHG